MHEKKFLFAVSYFTNLIREYFENPLTDDILRFFSAIELLFPIFKFINIIEITNECYLQELDAFHSNIVSFYQNGKKYDLSANEEGDSEIFYYHFLYFYLFNITKDTFKKFHCRLGTWTMKGFEYRNKQSKRMFVSHSNKKGNISHQTMKALHKEHKYNVS